MSENSNEFDKYIYETYCRILRKNPQLSKLFIPPPLPEDEPNFNLFPFYKNLIKLQSKIQSKDNKKEIIQQLINEVHEKLPFICDQQIHQNRCSKNQIVEQFTLKFDEDNITLDKVMYFPIKIHENDKLINNPLFCDQSHYFKRQYNEKIPLEEVIKSIDHSELEVILMFWRIKILLEEILMTKININLYPGQHNFSITIKNGEQDLLFFLNENHKKQFLTQNFITNKKAIEDFSIDTLFRKKQIKEIIMPLFKKQSLDEILKTEISYIVGENRGFAQSEQQDDIHVFFKEQDPKQFNTSHSKSVFWKADQKYVTYQEKNTLLIEECDFSYYFYLLCDFRNKEEIFEHKIIFDKQPICSKCKIVVESHNYNKLVADPQLIIIFERFQEISRFSGGFPDCSYENELYLQIKNIDDVEWARLYFYNNDFKNIISKFVFYSKNENYDLAELNQEENYDTYFHNTFDHTQEQNEIQEKNQMGVQIQEQEILEGRSEILRLNQGTYQMDEKEESLPQFNQISSKGQGSFQYESRQGSLEFEYREQQITEVYDDVKNS